MKKGLSLSPAGSSLLNVADLAEMFGVHQDTIWLWTAKGVIPQPLRISHRVTRWSRSAIDLFLASKTG